MTPKVNAYMFISIPINNIIEFKEIVCKKVLIIDRINDSRAVVAHRTKQECIENRIHNSLSDESTGTRYSAVLHYAHTHIHVRKKGG